MIISPAFKNPIFYLHLKAIVLVLAFLLFMKVITMIAIPTANGTNTITIAPATAPIILPNILSITLLWIIAKTISCLCS
jgi:hypothetical protein